MKKTIYIGCVVALLCACSAVNTIPLDDAYIWPDKKAEQAAQSAQTAQTTASTPVVQTTTPAPTMEIVSQKDTTITVRIKK